MNEHLDWLPLVLLAAIAVALAIPLRRMNVPWFVGAPTAGLGSAIVLILIGTLLSREPEPFIFVAMFFATLYGAIFALIAYMVMALIRRWR